VTGQLKRHVNGGLLVWFISPGTGFIVWTSLEQPRSGVMFSKHWVDSDFVDASGWPEDGSEPFSSLSPWDTFSWKSTVPDVVRYAMCGDLADLVKGRQ
jgi:hypothetical protein